MKPSEPEIPDKRYFKIGEVSALTGIESYVLRYWETEFPQIKPFRSRASQRLYRRQDIETILEIRDLLYRKKYTIAGAKQHLAKGRRNTSAASGGKEPVSLKELREELAAIRDLLAR